MGDALSHQAAALDFLRQGRVQEAFRSAAAALAEAPNLVEARYILGECYGRQGAFSELVRALEQVIQLDPNHAPAYHGLGVGYAQLGMLPQAAEAYKRAVSLSPDEPASWFGLGVACGKLGRFSEAAEALSRAVQRAPEMADAWHALAMAASRLGDLQRAIAAWERVVQLAPKKVGAWQELGIALQRVDRLEAAVAALQTAVSLAPDSHDLRCALGVALQQRGLNDAAAEEYRAALRLRPDWEQARYWLAAVGGAPAPPTAPPSYIREHFDRYAETFEQYLVDVLRYHVPEHLVGAALAAMGPQPGATRPVVFDAGCGTGLCGHFIRPHAARLIGVDLAPRMIEQARCRGVYDELIEGELHEALRRFPRSIDLILVADVLIYVGEARPLFQAAREALRPGGLLAVSIEGIENAGYLLRPSRRYAHSRAYLTGLATEHGFEVASATPTVIRKESDADVPGWLLVWRKQ